MIEASKYYQKALAIEPNVDVYRRLANYYRITKDWANANVYLLKVVESNPEPSELTQIYIMIGKNYDEMKDKKKMVEFIKSLKVSKEIRSMLYYWQVIQFSENYAKLLAMPILR
jgi:tetratricopeptide (TPR) repeat protein